MTQKLSIAVLFIGWGTVGIFLLTDHAGFAIRVVNYLYLLTFLIVLGRLAFYEKD